MNARGASVGDYADLVCLCLRCAAEMDAKEVLDT